MRGISYGFTAFCYIIYNRKMVHRCEPFFIEVIPITQKEFYKSRPWKRARKKFIEYRESIDGGICQICGIEPGYIVHHTIWLDDILCNDPNISLNQDLFLYECLACHNKEIDPRKSKSGRFFYGPNGEIIRNTDY